MIIKSKPTISIKLISNYKVVKSITSKKMRRINRFIEANFSQNCVSKVSVKYAPAVYNKGDYETKEELIYALKVFLESGLY